MVQQGRETIRSKRKLKREREQERENEQRGREDVALGR